MNEGNDRMGQKNLSNIGRRLTLVLGAERVNGLGRAVRFCQRERIITPYRLALSLVASCATMRVQTLADVHRTFNALFATTVAYKPFHNQLAKSRFGEFMRELVALMLEHWVMRTLRAAPGGAFAEFERVVIQDGSSFALKQTLAGVYPGRFKHKGPAAVELHVSLDWLSESVSRVALTPDTFAERAELPEAASLRGALLLADRGYFDIKYLKSLLDNEAHFVIRGYVSMNPTVLRAYDEAGRVLRGYTEQPLQSVRKPKRKMLDLDVLWMHRGEPVCVRVVVSWNAKKKQYRYLVTNLSRERYSVVQITHAYRLRWQVELLFKEWKSYANLHAFDTNNASIAEGMIWAAIGAALLKRLLAHATQHIHGVEISTRKVAMCAHHVLTNIFEVLAAERPRRLRRVLTAALDYLARNALRAHPKRDRRSGRLSTGFEPVFGCP